MHIARACWPSSSVTLAGLGAERAAANAATKKNRIDPHVRPRPLSGWEGARRAGQHCRRGAPRSRKRAGETLLWGAFLRWPKNFSFANGVSFACWLSAIAADQYLLASPIQGKHSIGTLGGKRLCQHVGDLAIAHPVFPTRRD